MEMIFSNNQRPLYLLQLEDFSGPLLQASHLGHQWAPLGTRRSLPYADGRRGCLLAREMGPCVMGLVLCVKMVPWTLQDLAPCGSMRRKLVHLRWVLIDAC